MCDLDRLPPRQRAVFEFIHEELRRGAVCPSFRDIARHFGIASPNGAAAHLKALERKGFIRRERGRSRAIQILNRESPGLPLVGVIGAGPLAQAIQAIEPFDLDAITGNSANVAVLVADDSLRHQHVVAGDYLIGPRKGRSVDPRWVIRRIVK
jgi:repressor LexA